MATSYECHHDDQFGKTATVQPAKGKNSETVKHSGKRGLGGAMDLNMKEANTSIQFRLNPG